MLIARLLIQHYWRLHRSVLLVLLAVWTSQKEAKQDEGLLSASISQLVDDRSVFTSILAIIQQIRGCRRRIALRWLYLKLESRMNVHLCVRTCEPRRREKKMRCLEEHLVTTKPKPKVLLIETISASGGDGWASLAGRARGPTRTSSGVRSVQEEHPRCRVASLANRFAYR